MLLIYNFSLTFVETTSWLESGVQGLQSVVLYSLPELDGAIETIVLGVTRIMNILWCDVNHSLFLVFSSLSLLSNSPPHTLSVSLCLH